MTKEELDRELVERERRRRRMSGNILTLINTFNNARTKGLDTREITEYLAKEIVALSFYRYYEEGEYQNEPVENELINYVKQKLKNNKYISPLFKENEGNKEFSAQDFLCGIKDENDNLIIKYDWIYSEVPSKYSKNEFLNECKIEQATGYTVRGVITPKSISNMEHMYILDNDSPTEFNCSTKWYEYEELFREEDKYICRKYGENEVESVNFVFPNQERFYENCVYNIGEIVGSPGEVTRYTKNKMEQLSYTTQVIEYEGRSEDDYYKGKTATVDIPKCYYSKKISGREWRKLEESTRIYNLEQDKKTTLLGRLGGKGKK